MVRECDMIFRASIEFLYWLGNVMKRVARRWIKMVGQKNFSTTSFRAWREINLGRGGGLHKVKDRPGDARGAIHVPIAADAVGVDAERARVTIFAHPSTKEGRTALAAKCVNGIKQPPFVRFGNRPRHLPLRICFGIVLVAGIAAHRDRFADKKWTARIVLVTEIADGIADGT